MGASLWIDTSRQWISFVIVWDPTISSRTFFGWSVVSPLSCKTNSVMKIRYQNLDAIFHGNESWSRSCERGERCVGKRASIQVVMWLEKRFLCCFKHVVRCVCGGKRWNRCASSLFKHVCSTWTYESSGLRDHWGIIQKRVQCTDV